PVALGQVQGGDVQVVPGLVAPPPGLVALFAGLFLLPFGGLLGVLGGRAQLVFALVRRRLQDHAHAQGQRRDQHHGRPRPPQRPVATHPPPGPRPPRLLVGGDRLVRPPRPRARPPRRPLARPPPPAPR